MLPTIAFYTIAFLLLCSSLLTVTSKTVVRSGVALFFSFLSMVALYLLLRLEFLAFVQLFIFVGAISVLVLFSLMMMQEYGVQKTNPLSKFAGVGVMVAAFVFVGLFLFLRNFISTVPAATEPATDSFSLVATSLLTTYVFPFELISLVLLAALIGAVVLVKKEEPDA